MFKLACIPFALQVVPTIYSDVRNNTIYSNQYSVTEHFKRAEIQQGQNMPGVFFFYDLSPIKVYELPACHYLHYGCPCDHNRMHAYVCMT